MDNIVAGMFGLSPNQIQQQQQAQTYQRAQNFAGQSPFERANSLMYQGGAGAANVGAGMMGLVNPEVEAAKQRQAALQGADVQTPEGLRALAARLQSMGMTQQAMIVAAKANEMEAGIQEGMVRSTAMAKNLALAEKAQRPEQGNVEAPSSDMKNAAAIADSKGLSRGTPEWNKEFLFQMELERKGKGINVTNVLPGEKLAIDIPKFRNQVQDTIKPYISTSDAADTSLSMLNLAIKQNNPTSYQGARVQLAKAFGDSNITGSEIKAAGGDPSIWGSLKDSASTLFTGTPSKDTMYAMKRTLEALKKVAESKGKKEIDIQKRIARNSGIKDVDIENIFDFPQFSSSGTSNGVDTSNPLLR